MLEGKTSTELWLSWVPEAWPCTDAGHAVQHGSRHGTVLLLVLLLPALLVVPPMLLLCRGRRLCSREAPRAILVSHAVTTPASTMTSVQMQGKQAAAPAAVPAKVPEPTASV